MMAKGRKLTTSRSERLLGSSYSYGGSTVHTDAPELGEEDVWSMVDDMVGREDYTGYHNINHRNNNNHSNSLGEWGTRASSESNGYQAIMSRRRLQRNGRPVGGLSLAFEDSGKATTASSRVVHQFCGYESVASPRVRHLATSAPVNVPDWRKILRVDSVESLHEMDDGVDDLDSEMVPPHEYLAREYARSRKMAANSVFEGVGRTLKGRDMSRVRDAVWSQTGFDG